MDELIGKQLLPIFKEHNLKAIHNRIELLQAHHRVVTNIQRTQFKSNSQRFEVSESDKQGCYQYSKNTI